MTTEIDNTGGATTLAELVARTCDPESQALLYRGRLARAEAWYAGLECQACDGDGSRPGDACCSACGGSGGYAGLECRACNGDGSRPGDACCSACGGSGEPPARLVKTSDRHWWRRRNRTPRERRACYLGGHHGRFWFLAEAEA